MRSVHIEINGGESNSTPLKIQEIQMSKQQTELSSLKALLRRPTHVITKEDGEIYHKSRRVWNGLADKKPLYIVKVSGVADVIRCVKWAVANDIPLSVRSGGHSGAGLCVVNDGLVIDMENMKGVRVDPQNNTARAESGVLLGEFDHETLAFGLATTAGSVSHTGLIGMTLGGGVGWLARKYGLTIDSVLSFDIVLADGRFLTVSKESHPDLFWALRGAGPNFGVVTSIEYQLYPVDYVLSGALFYHIEDAADVLRFVLKFNETAPNDLTVYCHLLTKANNKKTLAVMFSYIGKKEDGERITKPLVEHGKPFLTNIKYIPYEEMQKAGDDLSPPFRKYFVKTGCVHQFCDEIVDILLDAFKEAPSALSWISITQVGGKIKEVDPTDTAYPMRPAEYSIEIMSSWTEEDPYIRDINIQWTMGLFDQLQGWLIGVYSNFMGVDELDTSEPVKQAFGVNLNRLKTIKQKYDPNNIFRSNINITPSGK